MIASPDDQFTLERSGECEVPGYLVLRVARPDAALTNLEPAEAARLGAVLAAAGRAIAGATAAERVYVLSFCEVDARLHFHLFPRTRWLLEAYHAGTGTAGRPVSGPALFEWARRAFPPGAALPAAAGDTRSAESEIERRLAAPADAIR